MTTPESIALTMRHDFGLLEGRQREAVLHEATQIWEHHVKPLLESLSSRIDKHYDAKHPHIVCPVYDPVAVEREINTDGWTVGMNWCCSGPEQEQPDGRWLLYLEPLDPDPMFIYMVRLKGTDKHWSGDSYDSWCWHVYRSPVAADLVLKASRDSEIAAEIVRYRLVEEEVVEV